MITLTAITSYLTFDVVIFVVLLAFIIDGIKLLIESNTKIIKRVGYNRKKDLTIVLSAYNESNILESIRTFKNQTYNLVIINDKSTDDTLSKLFSLGEIINEEEGENETIYTIKDGKYTYKIVDNHENKGKVESIHFGVGLVDTQYVFICDGDIYLANDFEMPISLLEDADEQIDSVAFSVLPKKEKRSVWSNIIVGLQMHEYHKSMNIGRQFANNSKSVECISGAAGLFKTNRLKKQSKFHSNEFSGEDLERTLIELFDDGKTVFVDQIIHTDVPNSLWGLTKQRFLKWWPGFYRLFPLLLRLFRKRKIKKRLRYEIFYNMLSMILEPFKVISFWLLVIYVNLPILILLYLIYFVFELYMYFRIKRRTNYEIKYSPLQIFLYPIYGIYQLHLKIISMIRFFYLKIRRKVKPLRYKGIKTAALLFLFISLSLFGNAQEVENTETDKNWSVTVQHSQYDLRGEWESNNLVYVGYDKWYVQYHHGLYNQINVGRYVGNFLFDLGYRKNTLTAYTLYEHWLGNQTLRGQLRYNYNYGSVVDTDIYPNTPIVGVGFGSYHENTTLTVDVLKELERENSWILTGRVNQNITNRLAFQTGFSINDKKHYSTTNKLQYGVLYVFGSYHNNFDYTGLDYIEVGAGIQIKF